MVSVESVHFKVQFLIFAGETIYISRWKPLTLPRVGRIWIRLRKYSCTGDVSNRAISLSGDAGLLDFCEASSSCQSRKGRNMGRLNLTRRSFFKSAAVLGAVAALGGTSASATGVLSASAVDASASEVKHIRSACRGCGKMECGVWVTVENGRVVRTEGDESAFQSAGSHCAKGQASLQAAYHPDRLRYPMKRTTPKGEAPAWERISWDEAYKATVDAIHGNQEKYGKETCIFSLWGQLSP